MTATRLDPGTRLKAGPLFFSVTSPHPMMPQRRMLFSMVIDVGMVKLYHPKDQNPVMMDA
jgi:hypothetical protein